VRIYFIPEFTTTPSFYDQITITNTAIRKLIL
jgi:hypothetical protein